MPEHTLTGNIQEHRGFRSKIFANQRDVLVYLIGVLGDSDAHGRVFEIGGVDVVTYRQIMDVYAQVAGLRKRVIVPVPVNARREARSAGTARLRCPARWWLVSSGACAGLR